MRAPEERGAAVDPARRRRWADEFTSYKTNVLERHVLEWLDQFDEGPDRDLAARVLDVVDFYPMPRMEKAFRDGLALLPGWSIDPRQRSGKWRFCQFASTSGKSGDAMIYHFRAASRMNYPQYDELFIGKSDIPLAGLESNDTLVFVDDFVGTGTTAIDAFEKGFFRELVAGIGTVYLVTIAARFDALAAVLERTSMTVRTPNVLASEESPLSERCPHFTADERERLVFYGERANRKIPKGFGDCGLVVVFQHNCPNNSLPILHSRSKEWHPLFPRQG